MPVEVRVRGLIMENQSKSPIVILQEVGGERVLPIWIGESEARAIGMILSKEKLERPLTHDLLAMIFKGLGARVVSITITSLRENTFFAEIHLDQDGRQVVVDARPSDSLAIALKAEASIFVAEEVLSMSGHTTGTAPVPPKPGDKEKAAQLKKFLEDLDPRDFGKYGL